MPRSASGMSTGPGIRQVLLPIVDPTDTAIAIWVDPPPGLPTQKRWGYVKVERVINQTLAIDVVGRSLWVRGTYLFLPFQASNFVLTGFWSQQGVPWTAISGTP